MKGRLSRARDLLRDRLSRRGLALSTGGLSAILVAQPVSAALPAALADQALRSALLFAAGEAVESATVNTLVKGVLDMLFVSKVKLAAAVLALVVGMMGLGLWGYQALSGAQGAGALAATAFVPLVDETKPEVPPGQVAIGKPDKHGLVTMFRPLVTQLAAGDPLSAKYSRAWPGARWWKPKTARCRWRGSASAQGSGATT